MALGRGVRHRPSTRTASIAAITPAPA